MTPKTWVLLDVVTKVNLSICVECHEAEHEDIVTAQSLNVLEYFILQKYLIFCAVSSS